MKHQELSVDLIIVIATYNERQTLPKLVEQIWRYLPQANVLVVDDNSPDGTGKWARELATTNPRLELLHRENKEGLGAATIAGMVHAMSRQPIWIATMDADLSHRAEDLSRMWAETSDDRFDVIIGSRYVRGGRIENWSVLRRLASRMVNCFARWVLWLRSRDNSIAFRIYRTAALGKIELDKIDCRGFVYLEQILVHLQRSGASFAEVPIVFHDREDGVSKVTISELSRNLRDIFKLAIKRA